MIMDERPQKASRREILFSAGEKANVVVEFNPGAGATYEILMQIQKKLEAMNIPTVLTNGGISFSVTKDNNAGVEAMLSEHGLEMKETDIKKYDGDSAGRSIVAENQN